MSHSLSSLPLIQATDSMHTIWELPLQFYKFLFDRGARLDPPPTPTQIAAGESLTWTFGKSDIAQVDNEARNFAFPHDYTRSFRHLSQIENAKSK